METAVGWADSPDPQQRQATAWEPWMAGWTLEPPAETGIDQDDVETSGGDEPDSVETSG